jgi:hypothetical protein
MGVGRRFEYFHPAVPTYGAYLSPQHVIYGRGKISNWFKRAGNKIFQTGRKIFNIPLVQSALKYIGPLVKNKIADVFGQPAADAAEKYGKEVVNYIADKVKDGDDLFQTGNGAKIKGDAKKRGNGLTLHGGTPHGGALSNLSTTEKESLNTLKNNAQDLAVTQLNLSQMTKKNINKRSAAILSELLSAQNS